MLSAGVFIGCLVLMAVELRDQDKRAPGPDTDWYTHVQIDGRWYHEYDRYLNHQASRARAKERGVSVDWMLCDCAAGLRSQPSDEKGSGR